MRSVVGKSRFLKCLFFLTHSGPRWIETAAGWQPVQGVRNAWKGKQSVSDLRRSGSAGSGWYALYSAYHLYMDSTYPPSFFFLYLFFNPLHSVKLKHFEKFQDTTEALAGNGRTAVSNLTHLCLRATWSMMHFCVWLKNEAFHSIRHYHWDPQCVQISNRSTVEVLIELPGRRNIQTK